MGHSHLHMHKRQHQHRGDPLQDLENGFQSLTAAAGQFFGGGGSNNNNNNANNGPPAPAAATNKKAGNAPSTVYVTASWTGTGDFSLSTQVPVADPTPSSPQEVDPDPTTAPSVEAPTPTTTLVKSTKQQTTSALAAITTSATAAATTALSSLDSTTSDLSTASAAAATGTTAAVTTGQDTGLSGGAKAGIAIGVILGLIALAAAAFFLWRRKQSRDQEAYDFTANNNEKNPFSDHAADHLPPMPTSQPAHSPPTYTQPAANPFIDGPTSVSGTMTSASTMPTGAAAGAAAGLAGGAVVGAAAAEARRNSVPAPLNLNRAQSPALIPPPVIASSPATSNFSESSLVPVVTSANAPPPRMHRVQMDFNPTMEDELQIRAGEIVRIVRDFDDGWCTVEIVDRDRSNGTVTRHQQGVVPRTCLSRLPLKPRSRKDGRPGSPPKKAVPQSLSPGVGRTQSPALVSGPARRSVSPGPYGGGPQDRPQRPAESRSRSNSANDIGAARPKIGAIGPSPMNPSHQANNDFPVGLPIQSQSPLPMPLAPGHSRTESAPIPAPLNPSHLRSASKESAASVPVSRKPVPKKADP